MIGKTRKLTAALVAAGVLSASMLSAPVVAQSLGASAGQGVFVPYYTVNDGWRTLVNVSNTSENSLAVKVRLHEARNSRDVLDFIVLLSPYDVWSAFIEPGVNGEPVLKTTDRSCTVPLSVRNSGASASTLAYSGVFSDHTATDGVIDRMSEGYVEILVMGETAGQGTAPSGDSTNIDNTDASNFRGSTAWFAKHEAGEPRNCGLIQNDFVRRTAVWAGGATDPIPGAEGSGDPIARLGSTNSRPDFTGILAQDSAVGYGEILSDAPLKVNASLVNQSQGVSAGIDPIHIPGWATGQNLMTAQQFPWFLEPSLASGAGLWTTDFLTAGIAGVGTSTVKNEWTSNPGTGASADWVVTFPAKRFQADEDSANVQAACNVWRNAVSSGGAVSAEEGAVFAGWGATATRPNRVVADADLDAETSICPVLNFPTQFQDGNDGRADIRVSYDIYDREEGSVAFDVDGPVVSPAPPAQVVIDNLPYEANVLRIGRGADSLPSALDSLIAGAVDTSTLVSGANSGWVEMSFPEPYLTTGFIFKKRDFGNPALNFGSANSHGYDF